MKIQLTIPPGIEKRVSTWNELAVRWTKEKKTSNPCITISREFGCQAYPLAETLHGRLNEQADKETTWALLDRMLLEEIAQKSGYAKAELEYITNVDPTFQSMITTFLGRARAEPFEVFSYIKKTVRYFAKAGNSIIVGRGGVCLTQDLPNVLHVRLIAPLSFKLGIIMGYLGNTEKEARKHIESCQVERDNFTRHFTKMDLSNPHLYHLLINNEKFSVEEIADIIIDRIGKFSSK
jgi:cytidylate kinase